VSFSQIFSLMITCHEMFRIHCTHSISPLHRAAAGDLALNALAGLQSRHRQLKEAVETAQTTFHHKDAATRKILERKIALGPVSRARLETNLQEHRSALTMAQAFFAELLLPLHDPKTEQQACTLVPGLQALKPAPQVTMVQRQVPGMCQAVTIYPANVANTFSFPESHTHAHHLVVHDQLQELSNREAQLHTACDELQDWQPPLASMLHHTAQLSIQERMQVFMDRLEIGIRECQAWLTHHKHVRQPSEPPSVTAPRYELIERVEGLLRHAHSQACSCVLNL
jgi:hypothetical protein